MSVSGWVPVHVFAGDGLNSSPGVQLQQGVDSRVPIDVGRYGLDSLFILRHDPDYAKAISNLARRGPFPIPLCACGATSARPNVASPPQSRSSSFSDCATPVADKSAWRKYLGGLVSRSPGITSCAIVAGLAG